MTDALAKEKSYTSALRKAEKTLAENFKLLTKIPQVNPENLREVLEALLPKGMAPQNIGDLSEVIWPFQYDFEFELPVDDASNPTKVIIPSNMDLKDRVQVSSEAGFIVFAISRSFTNLDASGFSAPLTALIQDPQVSKYMMDKPMPITHFGVRNNPSKLPMPMYIPSNSNIQCNLRSFLNANLEVNGATSSKHTITLTGVRLRSDLASEVLKAMKLS